jgi:hypothetical protein
VVLFTSNKRPIHPSCQNLSHTFSDTLRQARTLLGSPSSRESSTRQCTFTMPSISSSTVPASGTNSSYTYTLVGLIPVGVKYGIDCQVSACHPALPPVSRNTRQPKDERDKSRDSTWPVRPALKQPSPVLSPRYPHHLSNCSTTFFLEF